MRRIAAGVLMLALLGGCGTEDVPSSPPPATPYAGPMVVERDFADDASVLRRSGAAGLALECEGEPFDGGGGAYDSGLEETQDSPSDAIGNFLDEEGVGAGVPDTGYRVERRDGGRELLSYDVDRRTVIAFTVSDDIVDHRGKKGWGVESWAQCDPAELPAELVDDSYLQVWTDARGDRVPVSLISSYQGAEHCDWEDITFLLMGDDFRDPSYVRDVTGELNELVTGVFDPSASLPTEARDTDYRRRDRELWLTDDTAYLVKIDDPKDVEAWPRAKERIGCA